MPNQTNPAPLCATIELTRKNGPTTTHQITRGQNEKNFVDAVGRFVQQQGLSPNHLIEKWNSNTQIIELIETDDAPRTEGTRF